MDIRKVKKLIELLESSNLTEIEIKEGEEAVKIKKFSDNYPVHGATPIVAASSPAINNNQAQASTNNNKEPARLGSAITSPMVGTFYSKPSPDAKPFVTKGQKVNAGDVVCIVEAMKIMNKIEADKSGVITQVLLNDGDAVEFEQELFIVE